MGPTLALPSSGSLFGILWPATIVVASPPLDGPGNDINYAKCPNPI